MNALLVIDAQYGLIKQKNFKNEIKKIKELILTFKANKEIIIFTQHLDNDENNILFKDSPNVEIVKELKVYADYIVKKSTADAFFNTNLQDILIKHSIDNIVICGFNTEYCCMFTAIAGFDRGYKVTFIEDATGTVGDENLYEMPGLDIKDFVGSVLNWSNIIKVLYFDEFMEKR
ncbi:streptothricin hydrolase [Clostridium tepidiprofundi DSM 19306]|uniref:Streptothricin hydrolase n=1 Tax=Clostridium tepidiprofundi DSM 19306 TaxID=1121338 RepID=A0A151AS65_9CLOT|nr:isochorismatase family protein [Clostridium tepidiprofundi]KYH30432.1 streptothricin hydrolase [Clostridium tepidiprofundi DSM 19306]